MNADVNNSKIDDNNNQFEAAQMEILCATLYKYLITNELCDITLEAGIDQEK